MENHFLMMEKQSPERTGVWFMALIIWLLLASEIKSGSDFKGSRSF